MSGEIIESMLPRLLEFRREREWEQFHLPKELATALSIEAGELLELFLGGSMSPMRMSKLTRSGWRGYGRRLRMSSSTSYS